MLGEAGEFVTGARDFYAIFPSDDEWRLVSSGRTLGTIPLSNAVGAGSLVAFAGQRWRVVAVDDRSKVLEVELHRSGQIPKFDSLMNEPIHDRLVAEMRSVFSAEDMPPYLDVSAKELLRKGRAAFHDLGLKGTRFLASGKDTHVLLWRGTEMNSVFAIALASAGLDCVVHDIGVTVADTEPGQLRSIVAQIADNPPSVEDIADFVENLRVAKYDEMVPEPLLRRLWATANAGAGMELGDQARAIMEFSR